MRPRTLFLLGATPVGLTVLALSWRGPRPTAPVDAPSDTKTLASLQREVKLLKSRPQLPRVLVVPGATPGNDNHQPTPDPASDETTAREQVTRVATALADQFNGERPEPGWSTQKAAAIRAAIEASGGGTLLASTACGHTLCRVILESTSDEPIRALADRIAPQEPFRAGVFYTYEDVEGRRRAILYVVREGEDVRALFAGRL